MLGNLVCFIVCSLKHIRQEEIRIAKTSAYQSLVKTFQRISRFSHLSSIASWDMFTMMPPGGSAARGEALAEMSVLQHQILTDKKWVNGWLQRQVKI